MSNGDTRTVPTARRLVTSSSMTSRDYYVILVTSQCSKLSHSETIGTGSTIHVESLSATIAGLRSAKNDSGKYINKITVKILRDVACVLFHLEFHNLLGTDRCIINY